MIKAECISERINSKQIKIGEIYWLDSSSIWSDTEDWYIDVYRDKEKKEKVGNLMLLNHFTRVE